MDSEKDGFWQQKRRGDQGEPSTYARTELSGKRRSEGGTSLADIVKATMGMIMYMVTLVTDENTRMGREALHPVETQWGRPFQLEKEGIHYFYETKEGGGDGGLQG